MHNIQKRQQQRTFPRRFPLYHTATGRVCGKKSVSFKPYVVAALLATALSSLSHRHSTVCGKKSVSFKPYMVAAFCWQLPSPLYHTDTAQFAVKSPLVLNPTWWRLSACDCSPLPALSADVGLPPPAVAASPCPCGGGRADGAPSTWPAPGARTAHTPLSPPDGTNKATGLNHHVQQDRWGGGGVLWGRDKERQ